MRRVTIKQAEKLLREAFGNNIEIIRETSNIKLAKAKMRSEGRHQGGKLPYGHEINEQGKLALTTEGADSLSEMQKLHKDGFSYREIAYRVSSFGLPISHEAVRRILNRKEENDT